MPGPAYHDWTIASDSTLTALEAHPRLSTSASTRLVSLLAIFIVSLIAAYLPSASQRTTHFRVPRLVFFLAKHFGTGVILSTAFTHLLDAAFRNLDGVRWLGYKHWAALIVMLSIITIFLFEYCSHAYLESLSHHAEVHEEQTKSPRHSGENSPLLGGHREHRAEHDQLGSKNGHRLLGIAILQVGIMLHSCVIGVTMAVGTASQFASLLPAIVFHQIFEGLALGVRLTNLNPPTAPHPSTPSSEERHDRPTPHHSYRPQDAPPPSRIRRFLPLIMSSLFALPIPLILFISLFIPHLNEFSVNPPSSFYTIASYMETVHGDVLRGVTSAVSAGLLIYVSCVELLAEDFMHDADLHRSSVKHQSGALASFVLGALGMTVI